MKDVFDEKNDLRFIQFPVFDDGCSSMFESVQKLFKSRFVVWLKEKMKEDPKYMSKFVYFCTGMKYIPDIDLNPDWRIKVEFNYSEMTVDDGNCDPSAKVDLKKSFLPVVHT